MKKTALILFALFSTFSLLANDHPVTYPVVVKFQSFSSGVPDAKPMFAYIASFKKKYKIKKISYDRLGPMGREGEYIMAFRLAEMSKAKAAIFIKEVKKVVAKMKDNGSAVTEQDYKFDSAEWPNIKPEKKSI